MRVLEVQFGTYTAYNTADGKVDTKKKFTAEQHDMRWLPEERLLLIDGWRYELGAGGRFMADPIDLAVPPSPPWPLPTDDTSMFKPVSETFASKEDYVRALQEADGTDQPSKPAGPARKARRRKPG